MKQTIKLMDDVCFVNQALFFLTETAKSHVLKIMTQVSPFGEMFILCLFSLQ